MSLADSFLADLEDIEGAPLDAELIKSEESLGETIPLFPTLLSDPLFAEYMTRVRTTLAQPPPATQLTRASEDYILISSSSTFIPQIDSEIFAIYKHIAGIYAKRFPELEQVVLMPMDYIKVVDRLQNSMDIASVDLSDFLPNNIVVAITVTASTSSAGVPMGPSELSVIRTRIQTASQLNDAKRSILRFLESRMPRFAPNLSALLGPMLAAQLIASAGGVENLATMPSQNIEAVGAHKQALAGLSAASQSARVSLVSLSDLVSTCPVDTRRRAVRLVLGKAAIAARVDQFNGDTLGQTGAKLREGIIEALAKANEPPPARAIKPLPVPEEKPKARRGGKRQRRWKEKYGESEVMKQANRVQFGTASEEGAVGMVNVESGFGRIRKVKPKHMSIEQRIEAGSSGSSSSLAFGSSGGIQLMQPSKPVQPAATTGGKVDLFGTSLRFGSVIHQ